MVDGERGPGGEGVAIVGAGWMGSGIATVCALAGRSVAVMDLAEDALERCMRKVRWNLDVLKAGEELPPTLGDAAQRRIRTTNAMKEAVGGAGIVIEAVPEELALKQDVLRLIEALAPADAILGTNASHIPSTQIAIACQRPERIVGIHFFEPPFILKAVEVIRGELTSDEFFEAAVRFIESLGSIPIRVVRDRPSFVINALQNAVRREATALLEAGVTTQDEIDRASRYSFGIKYAALGPFKSGRSKAKGADYEYSAEGLAQAWTRSLALIELARACNEVEQHYGERD